jgi:hypothetical protein
MNRRIGRFVNSRRARRLAVAAVCLSAAVASGGCRSSTPGWNSFGWKKEPSPDAIAGVGPTTTYPLSPSATATPNAINSVAASPAGMQPQTANLAISGLGQQSPAGQAAGATSPAAAVANGYPGYPGYAAAQTASSAKSASQPAPAGAVASNGGYVFGQNAAMPGAATAGTQPASTPAYAASPASPQPNKPLYTTVGYPLPGTSSAANNASSITNVTSGSAAAPAAAYAGTPTAPPIASSAGPATSPAMTSGFAMPPTAAVASHSQSPAPATGGFMMPGIDVGAGAPEAQVAAAPAVQSPAMQSPPVQSSAVTPASGYTPGSTSGAIAYPAATTGSSSDSGSFYR